MQLYMALFPIEIVLYYKIFADIKDLQTADIKNLLIMIRSSNYKMLSGFQSALANIIFFLLSVLWDTY